MSKLSRVIARSGTVEAEGENGEKIIFELPPLTNAELLGMVDLLDKNTQKGITQMIFLTLKKTEPDVTIEEVNNMPAGLTMAMGNTIMKTSGLGELLTQKKRSLEQLMEKTGTRRSSIELLDKKLEEGEL